MTEAVISQQPYTLRMDQRANTKQVALKGDVVSLRLLFHVPFEKTNYKTYIKFNSSIWLVGVTVLHVTAVIHQAG